MDPRIQKQGAALPRICSICSSPIRPEQDGRSTAELKCGHEFHLDCIGTRFNAIGQMRCPSCGDVEQGEWRYAGEPSSAVNVARDVTEEANDPQYECTWCHFHGSAEQFIGHVWPELLTVLQIYFRQAPSSSSRQPYNAPLVYQNQAGHLGQTSVGVVVNSHEFPEFDQASPTRTPGLGPSPPWLQMPNNLPVSSASIVHAINVLRRQMSRSYAHPRNFSHRSVAVHTGYNAAASQGWAVGSSSSGPPSSQYRGFHGPSTDPGPSNAGGRSYMGAEAGFRPWNGSQTRSFPRPLNPQSNDVSHDHHRENGPSPPFPPRRHQM